MKEKIIIILSILLVALISSTICFGTAKFILNHQTHQTQITESTLLAQQLAHQAELERLKQLQANYNCITVFQQKNWPEIFQSNKTLKEDCAKLLLLESDQAATTKDFTTATAKLNLYLSVNPNASDLVKKKLNMYEQFLAQQTQPLIPWPGEVPHLFFHSLIVYPQLAFDTDPNALGYDEWMITRDEFTKILNELYSKNYILVDITDAIHVSPDGKVSRNDLKLPAGKKPFIISLDDLAYYDYMKKDGFAKRLVLDNDHRVATLVHQLDGTDAITRDGDTVPILDDFILNHPDFSYQNAKGTIALTGYEGVFGYRTNRLEQQPAIAAATTIANELKLTGWKIAYHSYSHRQPYSDNTATVDFVAYDFKLWQSQVVPIVGKTNIYIGPFGAIFKEGTPQRQFLMDKGFNIFAAVGIHEPTHYYPDHADTYRIDIDGYRMRNSAPFLEKFFTVKTVFDPLRPVIANNKP